MRKSKIIALCLPSLLLFALQTPLFSRTITVDCYGGGEFVSIQEGVDAAVDGDSVLVFEGTYFERLDFLGKSITVTSRNGPAATLIDAGFRPGNIVILYSEPSAEPVLDGFTIQNSQLGISVSGPAVITNNIVQGILDGAAIWLTAPFEEEIIVSGNSFTDNDGWCTLLCNWAYPLVINNTFTRNVAQYGVLWITFGDGFPGRCQETGINPANTGHTAFFLNNIVYNNSADAFRVYDLFYAIVVIANNAISFNSDNGIVCDASQDVRLIQNTIYQNGSHGIHATGFRERIENNIVCSNYGYGLVNCTDASHNNVWQNVSGDYLGCSSGPGDISEDPLFRAPASGDLHLTPESPCIDAGKTTLYGFDIDGDPRPFDDKFDIGADEWVSPLGPLLRLEQCRPPAGINSGGIIIWDTDQFIFEVLDNDAGANSADSWKVKRSNLTGE